MTAALIFPQAGMGSSPGEQQRAGEGDEPGGLPNRHTTRHEEALQQKDFLAAQESLHKHFDLAGALS